MIAEFRMANPLIFFLPFLGLISLQSAQADPVVVFPKKHLPHHGQNPKKIEQLALIEIDRFGSATATMRGLEMA